MPRFVSQLGNVVYIDDAGVVCEIGSLFDDGHFKSVVNQSDTTPDRTTTEERCPSLTVAFTTGSMEVKPLTEDDYSKYSPLSLEC